MDNSVQVPGELLRQVDMLVDYLDFESREAFVETAIRRFIEFYASLIPSLTTKSLLA